MKVLLFVLLGPSLTAGCNTAGPHFRDVSSTRIGVDGSVFDVRIKGNLAEAIRINPEYAPRFGPIRRRAMIAMETISGCDVIDILGDQALATGVLNCDARPLPSHRFVSPRCVPKGRHTTKSVGPQMVNLVCMGHR